jgi:tRNA(fMet)-specific endonuclease VapC
VSYLLDTCVVSEYMAKMPSLKVTAWLAGLESGAAFLSVITVGEIRQGISRLAPSRRREELEWWFSDRLLPRFEGRILSVDVPVMLVWGALTAELLEKGRPLSFMDSLLVAQARRHGLVIATRNEANFEGTAVAILNPWRS